MFVRSNDLTHHYNCGDSIPVGESLSSGDPVMSDGAPIEYLCAAEGPTEAHGWRTDDPGTDGHCTDIVCYANLEPR